MAPQYLIGLTGNTASGKSQVAQFLRDEGAAVLGYDDVQRGTFREPTTAQAVQAIVPFPAIAADGGLDIPTLKRELLTRPQIVPAVWAALETIAWPRTLEAIANANGDLLILEAAQLYERGWDRECNRTIAVIANDTVRTARLRERYARTGVPLSDEQVGLLLTQHIPQEEKARRSSYVIRNDTTLDDLAQATRGTYRQLRQDLGV